MTIWLLDHGADPNQQCSIDLNPMSYAVERASLSTIRLLLDRGADVQKGELLQHAAERRTEVVDVLDLLLENGAPLNARMYENHYFSYSLYCFMCLGTVLHRAADLGKVDAVRFLISRGIDVTVRDASGRTALDFAQESGYPEIIELLQPATGERKP